jgi:hypothetical protein
MYGGSTTFNICNLSPFVEVEESRMTPFKSRRIMRKSQTMCQTMDQLSPIKHQIHQYKDPFHGVMQINYSKRWTQSLLKLNIMQMIILYYLNFLHMYCWCLHIRELLLGQRRCVKQRMRWAMKKLNHHNDYWHQSHVSRDIHTNWSNLTISGAYEQKDNKVYIHLQQSAHRFDFPLRSNDHFRGDCQKAKGHARLWGTHGFPTFHLLLSRGNL